ncbi:AP-3 complex subunit beta-2-like [Rhinatrema bivittatum]|uniref:AP-3 complex subunit beta-2-like n=1 Tax=Rhinatrema bivittatum TaxID=194408 RepID=UPI00112E696D|nr:AP-3 complex subunit beta-2-like [Rhinatrema bivittatum]
MWEKVRQRQFSMKPMQKLLQLPVSAVNLVKSQNSEEAKSPVLSPDGSQQTWYSTVQADELRLLKSPSPESEPTVESGSNGSQTQALRHDDLKEMLDSNKDSLKLEAMKRIVAMIARGKNASDLFPAVVKNVACKNIEVKKLVYVYLVRYAEEQQDLALLSISTFQRGLKDPNQLIRASALRVLSSIRVPIIVPIMMLAIKEAASDMSPYVRKTAAHAIPKLYSLDSDQKDQLIEVIEKLLSDKTTLVAGSVVMAFEEVCPERIDLIHKNYRKLCNLLIDVEEWGQVVIINMLTRYARTQFLNPNHNESLLEENPEKAFYGSDDEDSKDEKTEAAAMVKRQPYVMDPDHRLLLRNTKPLLQSRNAAVVMAVAQLYFHLAPKAEIGVIAKGLVRLLRSHSEVQYVVLQNVATMSIKRRGMFEPYLKSFYIRSTDPTQIKVLKSLFHFCSPGLHLWLGLMRLPLICFLLGQVPEWTKCTSREKRKEKLEKPFYSDSEGESGPTESADSEPETVSESESESNSESGSGSGSEEEEEESGDQSESEKEERKKKRKEEPRKVTLEPVDSEQSEEEEEKKAIKKKQKGKVISKSSSEEGSSSESSSSESETESEEEEPEPEAKPKKPTPSTKPGPKSTKKSTKEISLLDLDDFTTPTTLPVSPSNVVSASLVTDLEGLSLTDTALTPSIISPVFSAVKTYELLHRMTGEGLSVEYFFNRQPFIPDPHMVAVQIQFSNNTDSEVKNVRITEPKLQSGMRIQEFKEIESLPSGDAATVIMGIDFCDSTQAANFQLCTHTRQFYVSIQPPVGELMAPIFMSENEFKKEQGKLTGMNEITEKLTLPVKCLNDHAIVQRVTSAANMSRVPCGGDNEYRFAAKTVSSGSLVLVTMTAKESGSAQLMVNSEKMVIGTMLVKDIIQALAQ